MPGLGEVDDVGTARALRLDRQPRILSPAFVSVETDEVGGDMDTGQRLAGLPEVQEVHHICGEDCYLIKVRVKSAEALGDLLRTKVGSIEGVRRTRSTIVMNTLLEGGRLPLDQALDGDTDD